jgi:hypothetical protein
VKAMTTLHDLEKVKMQYIATRRVLVERASVGLVSKIELMEFDIAHLNTFADLTMLYLRALQEDGK